MKKIMTLAVTLLPALVAQGTFAQINKCVDAAGKTYYTQAPCPPSAKSSTVRAAPPPANPPAAAPASGAAGAAAKSTGPKSAAELEVEFRKRRAEQEEAAKKNQEKAEESAQKEENCRNAKGSLASIDSGVRQTRINEKGERVVLDEAQSARERERAVKTVEQWCK